MPTTTTGVATEFINFTRASNATVTDSNGVIKWAAHNLLLASEQFDNSNWTKTRSTVTANATAAPNGTTTAEKIVEDSTASNDHRIQQTVAVQGSVVIGAYFKAAERTWGYLRIDDASTTKYAYFNLSTGVVGTVDAGLVASISAVGNGWYYCSAVFASPAVTALGVFVVGPASADNTASYTGNGTSGIFAWGAHLYRSDLGGMQANTSAYPMYNPTTPKNLLGFTESFDNAAWVKGNIAAFGSGSVSNAILAPNGLQIADFVVPTATSASHSVHQTITLASTVNAISVYAKAGGYNYAVIQINDAVANGAGASFDLSTGSIVGNVTTGTWTVASKSITPVGDGWYRISVVINATGTTRKLECEPRSTNSTTWAGAYTGDGTSGIYLWGAQLSDSASLDPYSPNHFTAPSAAAYYGPRRDFDPVTLACKGLLVEEQRANLMTYSNDMTQSIWTAYSAALSTTANSALGPDGLTTANTITLSANVRINFFAVTSGLTYTLSVWLRTDSGTKQVTIGDINETGANSTVTVTTTWQRFTRTITKTNTSAYVGIAQNAGVSPSTSGTLYAWGWQYELGSFATSYIPTTNAGATRNGDVAQVGTAAFPYSATEGTWVANYQTLFSGTISSTVYVLNLDGSASKRILYIGGGADAVASFDGTTIVGTAVDVTGPISKSASAYTSSERAVVSSGSTVSTGVSVASYASASTVNIGSTGSISGGGQLNGHIRQITYLPRRISNTELQTRTA